MSDRLVEFDGDHIDPSDIVEISKLQCFDNYDDPPGLTIWQRFRGYTSAVTSQYYGFVVVHSNRKNSSQYYFHDMTLEEAEEMRQKLIKLANGKKL